VHLARPGPCRPVPARTMPARHVPCCAVPAHRMAARTVSMGMRDSDAMALMDFLPEVARAREREGGEGSERE
jgi:hypothetical protein